MSEEKTGVDKLRECIQEDPKRFMDFMKRKAEEGKKEVYDQSSFQTQDYFFVAEQLKDLQQCESNLSGGNPSLSQEVANDISSRRSKVTEQSNGLQDQIRELQGKLNGVAADATRQKEACDKHFTNNINEKMLKEINYVLQKESPAILVDMLEGVVALMRNRNAANNIDVEIYFAEFKKLKLKMLTLDPAPLGDDDRHMTRELVEKHEQNLKNQQNHFMDGKWKKMQPILQWALLFCVYAKDKIQQAEFQKRLDELNNQMNATMDELKTCQTIEELLAGNGAPGDADKGALQQRRAIIEEMLQADTRQALDCQQQLADYEAVYQKIMASN